MKWIQINFLCIFFCVALTNNTNAQKLSFRPKLFSFHNAKFSMGIGIETSPDFAHIKASEPSSLRTKYKSPSANDDIHCPFISSGITFDFYSPNSILGLTFGANYAAQQTAIASKDESKFDFIRARRLELPLYLRIRPGERDNGSHIWLLFGGAYNIPLSGSRTRYIQNYDTYDNDFVDENKEQFQSYITLSTQIGIEAFTGSDGYNSRAVFYISGEYPLTNFLNENYSNFIYIQGDGVLSDYWRYEIKQYKIGIGLKLFFGSKRKK